MLVLAGARVPKVSLQAPGLVALKRNQPVAARPFGFAVPCSVAACLVTEVGATVVTVGAAGVVKDSTEPKPEPTEFEAMAQK